jgi:flagellar basal-body rod protein FlgG
MVGDGIRIPVNYKQIQIQADGTVGVKTKADPDNFKPVGKISLMRFANPEGLKSIGYNKLLASDASGQPVVDGDSKLKQGNLERANVNVNLQIEQILRLNAGLISNMRIIKFADDLYRQAVNLKQ